MAYYSIQVSDNIFACIAIETKRVHIKQIKFTHFIDVFIEEKNCEKINKLYLGLTQVRILTNFHNLLN